MGAVLNFPLDKVSRTGTKHMQGKKTAKVILFEGVHYSTQEEDKPCAASKKTPRKPRN
jgi:hypothetical protein